MIRLIGLSINNLKRIDVDIPQNMLVVISGVSGCGKSSLAKALDAESRKRYTEALPFHSGYHQHPIDMEIEDSKNLTPSIFLKQNQRKSKRIQQ